MRGTFFGIEIARTGLSLAQLGLDVTAHNIANVETKGYTRQRIIQTAYDPSSNIGRILPVAAAKVGAGTRVKVLDQIRSAYLDRRFRTENTTNSYWDTRSRELRYLESFFDNVNEETSINYSLSRLFSAMKVLAEDAVEGAPRKNLQTSGLDLVQQLNTIYDGLIDLQTSQNKAVNIVVDDINRIATEIVELNKSIYGFELTGHVANDLRDKRNLLIDELSEYVEIEYDEVTDKWGGTVMQVWIKDGYNKAEMGKPTSDQDIIFLVNHDERMALGVREEDNTITSETTKVWMPYWEAFIDRNGDKVPHDHIGDDLVMNKTVDLDGMRFGELKALMDMRDNYDVLLPGVPRYIEMLNDLARTLVYEINAVHREGWTDPPDGNSRNGINFFYEDNAWITWENGGGDTLTWDAVQNGWVDSTSTLVPDPAAAGYSRELDVSKITAKNIRLSAEVLESAFNIACSSQEIRKPGDPEGQQRGNNENMRDLFALFNRTDLSLVIGGDSKPIGSFDSFATSIRFDLGNTLFTAKNMADTSKTLTLAAENQRTSISGVSLDEEMTSLIKYNHAYNGASRVITAMDDALDRLINGTGRVGL